jgi:hypothetical protein
MSMSEEWFEVAYINFDEAILHGQIVVDRAQQEVRKVLSIAEKDRIVEMNERHQREMQKLLRSMAV